MLPIGTFFLGPDTDFAHSVFDSLQGGLTATENVLIRVDLEKNGDGVLPVRLKSKSCTLNQYAENCRIITRDIFKFFTLEQ